MILPRSANKEDEARLDILARGFWDSETGRNDSFFDVRVFHPGAPSYQNQSFSSLYRQHECKQRLAYGRRVLDVERGTFTPLVFTSGGGMSKETTTAMKAACQSGQRQAHRAVFVMGWLRCKATFSLLRSALACLRGSMPRTRSSDFTSISEAAADGQIAY